MRGGYLRYQAQYLRRIRLPRWHEVPKALREKLKEAARRGDTEECNRVTFELYDLNANERAALSTAATLSLSLLRGIETGENTDLSEMTSIRTFFTGFAARVAVEAARR